MWNEPQPPFVPHPWFRGPHRQTIGAAYLWKRFPYRAERKVIHLPDGDRLVAHDDNPPGPLGRRRVVMLVHGLAGCHGSGYMNRIAAKLVQSGYRAVRLDCRGCGAGMALARKSLHAGRTEDLRMALQHIGRLHPAHPVTAVGFSLGASILLKFLTQLGADHDLTLDSAIAVAPPLDLAACSRNLQHGWNRVYDRIFVRTLTRTVERRRRQIPDLEWAAWARRPGSLYDFDSQFTAPGGGFADVDDYYRRASSLPGLSDIQVATRILFAQDDPLIPAAVFRDATFSPTTEVYATPAGGHLGFLADRRATRDPDWHWMDWRVVDWVRHFDRLTPIPPPGN